MMENPKKKLFLHSQKYLQIKIYFRIHQLRTLIESADILIHNIVYTGYNNRSQSIHCSFFSHFYCEYVDTINDGQQSCHEIFSDGQLVNPICRGRVLDVQGIKICNYGHFCNPDEPKKLVFPLPREKESGILDSKIQPKGLSKKPKVGCEQNPYSNSFRGGQWTHTRTTSVSVSLIIGWQPHHRIRNLEHILHIILFKIYIQLFGESPLSIFLVFNLRKVLRCTF